MKIKMLFLTACVCGVIGGNAAMAQQQGLAGEVEQLQGEIVVLRRRLAELEKEFETLKNENRDMKQTMLQWVQYLRTQNAPPTKAPAPAAAAPVAGAPAKGAAAPAAAEPADKKNEEEKEHWLSNSGVRHNPDCKYFKNGTGGKPCGADEGRPCKVCGG